MSNFERWWFERRCSNPQLNVESTTMTITVEEFKRQQRKAYEAGRAETPSGNDPDDFFRGIFGKGFTS